MVEPPDRDPSEPAVPAPDEPTLVYPGGLPPAADVERTVVARAEPAVAVQPEPDEELVEIEEVRGGPPAGSRSA